MSKNLSGLVAEILILLYLLSSGCGRAYGAKVIVENASAESMRSVVVRVTGNSYELGDLGPHQTKSVETYPTGESGVMVEYVDGRGEKKSTAAGGYLEPGYQSTIKIRMSAESLPQVEQLK